MRRLHWVICWASCLLLSSCGFGGIRGSGNVITESREVSGFTAVSFGGSGQLVIEQSGAESLTITADDNLLPYLTSEVQGHTLRLETKDRTSVDPTRPIVYKLSVKNLDDIQVAGEAKVEAKGIQSENLRIGVAGSGEITINGTADQQDIAIAGSAKYQAEDLKSKVAAINISGSATAIVAASDKLDVNVTGSGDIEYIGDPVVTQKIVGAGSVRKR